MAIETSKDCPLRITLLPNSQVVNPSTPLRAMVLNESLAELERYEYRLLVQDSSSSSVTGSEWTSSQTAEISCPRCETVIVHVEVRTRGKSGSSVVYWMGQIYPNLSDSWDTSPPLLRIFLAQWLHELSFEEQFYNTVEGLWLFAFCMEHYHCKPTAPVNDFVRQLFWVDHVIGDKAREVIIKTARNTVGYRYSLSEGTFADLRTALTISLCSDALRFYRTALDCGNQTDTFIRTALLMAYSFYHGYRYGTLAVHEHPLADRGIIDDLHTPTSHCGTTSRLLSLSFAAVGIRNTVCDIISEQFGGHRVILMNLASVKIIIDAAYGLLHFGDLSAITSTVEFSGRRSGQLCTTAEQMCDPSNSLRVFDVLYPHQTVYERNWPRNVSPPR